MQITTVTMFSGGASESVRTWICESGKFIDVVASTASLRQLRTASEYTPDLVVKSSTTASITKRQSFTASATELATVMRRRAAARSADTWDPWPRMPAGHTHS